MKNTFKVKFDIVDKLEVKFDRLLWSNSNFEFKFDLTFVIQIRHFLSNSEFFRNSSELTLQLTSDSCLFKYAVFVSISWEHSQPEVT